eukprot:3014925-Prymnesium_polylepis.1
MADGGSIGRGQRGPNPLLKRPPLKSCPGPLGEPTWIFSFHRFRRGGVPDEPRNNNSNAVEQQSRATPCADGLIQVWPGWQRLEQRWRPRWLQTVRRW